VRVVAVDGRGGSGKTTFAGRLATALGDRAHVFHTDDALAKGWREVTGYWDQLDAVLSDLATGSPATYRRYDWDADRLGGAVTLPVPAVLVVEGVASLGATAGRRTLGVLVDAPRELRLARGVARDGAALRPQWQRWMTLEDAYFATRGASPLPDLVVDGSPVLLVPDDAFVVVERAA
jgi:uridine kinase